MSSSLRVLVAGESWVTHSIHQKGFGSFTTTAYYEGVGPLRDELESRGATVEYMPSHIAASAFPGTAKELSSFDVVMLSDNWCPPPFVSWDGSVTMWDNLVRWAAGG